MGFSVIILLLAATVAVSVSYLSRYRSTTRELVDHHVQEILTFGDLERILFEMKVELEVVITSVGSAQLEPFGEQRRAFRAGVERVRAEQEEFLDSFTPHVFSVLMGAPDRIDSTSTVMYGLAVQGEWDEVREIAEGIQNDLVAPLLRQTSVLLWAEDQQTKAMSLQILRQSSVARNRITLVSSIALILSLTMAVWTSTSITRPIKSLERTSVAISGGQLSLRSRLNRDDETGRLSRAFDHMVDSLERVLAEQRRFLADTSHNLLTPVTVIRGQLQVLRRSIQGASADEAFDLVFRELGRIKTILDELVLLAKSASVQALSYSEVRADEFLGDVFRSAEALGERSWQFEAPPLVKLRCDAGLLSAALLELAKNAVQHTETGGSIGLSGRLRSGGLAFEVADDGRGIHPEEHDRVFERFFRSRHSRGGEGSGLGLSIVKAVAEAHKGRVNVRSALGDGSTFTLWIPLA